MKKRGRPKGMGKSKREAVTESGAMLRKMRQERGLTLQQLSDLSGVSISSLSQWETGRINPRFESAFWVAEVCGFEITPRRRGAWEYKPDKMPHCTCCGFVPAFDTCADKYELSEYCPRCGAHLKGGHDETY